jgi:DNA processing protein
MELEPLLTLLPSEYPEQLREIPDPPDKLWLRGHMPPEDMKFLAVVGSRALTRYGREACEMLISGLAGYPISIVSGLALGADAAAHKAALAADLHTIAIPGSGLSDDVIGPRSNLGLAHQILKAGGALLSENEPDHIPYAADFPSRNRIMVGLSHAVLIIEAGPKSGSLITARLTSEYNRDLLCVPHRIGDPHGSAAEIFMRLGAAHITGSNHILEALGIEPRPDSPESVEQQQLRILADLSPTQRRVYELLERPMLRDDLVRATQHPASQALMTLIALELKGVIKEEFGLWRRA